MVETNVNLMVGGPQELIPFEMVKQRRHQHWVASDHGTVVLFQHGIKPDYAVGDFDSSSLKDYQAIRDSVKAVHVTPPEKDFTDTQLGVKTAFDNFRPRRLTIFGATGGRIDHFLANLFLPLEPQFAPYRARIRFVDRQNVIDYFNPGSHTIFKLHGMKYLAFVNLTAVKGLTLIDEKYQLNHYDSQRPISWASNEFLGSTNHFSFDSGVVAVIQSKDNDSDVFCDSGDSKQRTGADLSLFSRNLNPKANDQKHGH